MSPIQSQARRRAGAGLLCSAAILGAFACGPDATPARPLEPTDATHAYWDATLSHHAITLATTAPYDTIRLTLIPRDANGTALSVTGHIVFASTDSGAVQVDSSGNVHAIAPAQGVNIIATLAEGDQIHADTALVNVTSTSAAVPIGGLSIHPVPPDSAVIAIDVLFNFYSRLRLPVVATDTAGNAIGDIALSVVSADTTIATICSVSSSSISVCAKHGRPGRVAIIATTTTYGATRADTVMVTVTEPQLNTVVARQVVSAVGAPPTPSFVPSAVTIAVGGTVDWFNSVAFDGGWGQPMDVVFDDSTKANAPDSASFAFFLCHVLGGSASPDSGNIAAFGDSLTTTYANGCAARRFLTPGTYHYHSTLTGATGTVVVTAN